MDVSVDVSVEVSVDVAMNVSATCQSPAAGMAVATRGTSEEEGAKEGAGVAGAGTLTGTLEERRGGGETRGSGERRGGGGERRGSGGGVGLFSRLASTLIVARKKHPSRRATQQSCSMSSDGRSSDRSLIGPNRSSDDRSSAPGRVDKPGGGHSLADPTGVPTDDPWEAAVRNAEVEGRLKQC